MALVAKDWYVLKIMVADDSQGQHLRSHSIGIKAVTEDTWALLLADVNAYLTALGGVIDGIVVGWTLSRGYRWGGAISAPEGSETERKGIIPIEDATGRKGTLELPSLDETIMLSDGVGAGLYMDPDNADLVTYLALLETEDYLFPGDGVDIDVAVAGKKMHVASGVRRERIG